MKREKIFLLTVDQNDGVEADFGAKGLESEDSVSEVFASVEL